MIYKFYCKACDMEHDLDIPIAKYMDLKDKQRCPYCRKKLERVLEWTGTATINGGYEAVAGRAKWQQ